MLFTVPISGNKKTGPIAVTYRAGSKNVYGTCPKTCQLNAHEDMSTDEIDMEYLQAVYDAVPRRGKAWTYSHFHHDQLPAPRAGKTVINASCDTVEEAVQATKSGKPAVYAAPVGTKLPFTSQGVKFARCPAELSAEFNCMKCGDGDPLCARTTREYVVTFVAHGTSKAKVGAEKKGGCYAASGPVFMQWRNTMSKSPSDAEEVRRFASALPPGSMIRHHVTGDVGKDARKC